jgi:hypothetical protein
MGAQQGCFGTEQLSSPSSIYSGRWSRLKQDSRVQSVEKPAREKPSGRRLLARVV